MEEELETTEGSGKGIMESLGVLLDSIEGNYGESESSEASE